MSNVLRSIFFASICIYGAYNALYAQDNNTPSYKPFNYKAFEARKRGYKIIIPKVAEAISSLEYLKTVPTWPGYLRFPNPDNQQAVVHAQAEYNWASYCFNSSSDLKDISEMIFGTETPTLADISLISRLHQYSLNDWLADGKPATTSSTTASSGTTVLKSDWSWIARSTANATSADPEVAEFGTDGVTLANNFHAYQRYLAFLADEQFIFQSIMKQPCIILNYQTPLLENMLTIGIEVPIIYKIQKMDMIKDLSIVDNQILAGGGMSTTTGVQLPGAAWPIIGDRLQDSFPSAYPSGFKAFYDDLLSQKDFSANPRATKFGIGDISFIVNRRIENDYWTLGIVGLGITIPSAEPSSHKFVWPINLGNGGFWTARMHGALFWKHSNLANPHVLGEIYFCLPSAVERRVSQLINYDASSKTASVAAENLPLGKTLIYDQKSFTLEPESKIPALAAGPTQFVEFSKGATLLTRLGNIFDQAFLSNGALDIYYQFSYKFTDNLALKTESGLFDLPSLMNNTESWSQTLGLAYIYHWRDFISFELKGTTVFSGHNVLRTSSISLAVQMRF